MTAEPDHAEARYRSPYDCKWRPGTELPPAVDGQETYVVGCNVAPAHEAEKSGAGLFAYCLNVELEGRDDGPIKATGWQRVTLDGFEESDAPAVWTDDPHFVALLYQGIESLSALAVFLCCDGIPHFLENLPEPEDETDQLLELGRLADRGAITIETRPPGEDPRHFDCSLTKCYIQDERMTMLARDVDGWDFEITFPVPEAQP